MLRHLNADFMGGVEVLADRVSGSAVLDVQFCQSEMGPGWR